MIWVVSCRVHVKRGSLQYCYQQWDGSHITLKACTCGEQVRADCAIDYHRHLYVQRHPMFPLVSDLKKVMAEARQKAKVKDASGR